MDRDGKLNQAEKERLIAEIGRRQKGGNQVPPCELCGARAWVVGDHLVQGHIVRPNVGLALGGPTYTYAQLICSNCGHSKLLNAFVIGLLDPTKPIPSDDGGAG